MDMTTFTRAKKSSSQDIVALLRIIHRRGHRVVYERPEPFDPFLPFSSLHCWRIDEQQELLDAAGLRQLIIETLEQEMEAMVYERA